MLVAFAVSRFPSEPVRRARQRRGWPQQATPVSTPPLKSALTMAIRQLQDGYNTVARDTTARLKWTSDPRADNRLWWTSLRQLNAHNLCSGNITARQCNQINVRVKRNSQYLRVSERIFARARLGVFIERCPHRLHVSISNGQCERQTQSPILARYFSYLCSERQPGCGVWCIHVTPAP